MGYLVLWIESLAVWLLSMALVTAWVGRRRRRWLRNLVWISAAGWLLLIYAWPAELIGREKFFGQMPDAPGFYFFSTLALFFLVGVVLLRIGGLKRSAEGEGLTVSAQWPGMKLLAAWGVAGALLLMTWWNLDLAACQQLAALHAEAGALALSVAPARVPESENAAPLYRQASEALTPGKSLPKEYDRWEDWYAADSKSFNAQDPQLEQFLKERTGLVQLLHEAANKPACVLDLDYDGRLISEILPELQNWRTPARFLALHARYETARGNPHAALQDVDALFKLARHCGDEPLLISLLLGIALEQTAAESLQNVLTTASLTAEDLESLKIDEFTSWQKQFQRAFRMEEVLQMSFLELYASGNLPQTSENNHGPAVPQMPAPMAQVFRIFSLQADQETQRRICEEFRKLVALPYYQAAAKWEDLNRDEQFLLRPSGIISYLSVLTLPALSSAHRSVARGDALHATAVLALALERYHAKHGRFPDQLDELTPEFLVLSPLDPFDGKPMKYKRTEHGVIVYSIGPDMIDDGGQPIDETQKERKGDVVFELPEWKAEK
jgi:hypothetical protein